MMNSLSCGYCMGGLAACHAVNGAVTNSVQLMYVAVGQNPSSLVNIQKTYKIDYHRMVSISQKYYLTYCLSSFLLKPRRSKVRPGGTQRKILVERLDGCWKSIKKTYGFLWFSIELHRKTGDLFPKVATQ